MEEFEEWWKEQPDEPRAGQTYSYNALKSLSSHAWQACAAIKDKRIAELEAEIKDRAETEGSLLVELVKDELGVVCCGGVDGPISDPHGIAGAIIMAIRQLKKTIDGLKQSEHDKIIGGDSMGQQIEDLQRLLKDIRKDLANYHLMDDDRISIAMSKIDAASA